MARYTDETAVKLALRAPGSSSATSWTDGTYDDLIDAACEEADVHIDDLCAAWSPFDEGTTTEERTFIADGSAVYGILSTDSYVALPTSVSLNGTAVTKYKAYIKPRVDHSGRSLEGSWREGASYDVTAEWEHVDIPPGVHLAATRIAAKSFVAERNAMNQGVVETTSGAMYEPRFDPYVKRWLSRWMGSEVQ